MKRKFFRFVLLGGALLASVVVLMACGNSKSNSSSVSTQSSSTSESSLSSGPNLKADIGTFDSSAWTALTLQQQEQVFMNSYKKFAPDFDGGMLVPALKSFDVTDNSGSDLSPNNLGGYAIGKNAQGQLAINDPSEDKSELGDVILNPVSSTTASSNLANTQSIFTLLVSDSTAYIKMLQSYTEEKNTQALINIDYLMSGNGNISSSDTQAPTPIANYQRTMFDPTNTDSQPNNKLELLIQDVSQGKSGNVTTFLNFRTSNITTYAAAKAAANASNKGWISGSSPYNYASYGNPNPDAQAPNVIQDSMDDTYLATPVYYNVGKKDATDINSSAETYSFSASNGDDGEYTFNTFPIEDNSDTPEFFPTTISPFTCIVYSQANNMIFFVLPNSTN